MKDLYHFHRIEFLALFAKKAPKLCRGIACFFSKERRL